MENSTAFPKRPSVPAYFLHAVGVDQTPHYVQAVMKVGSRSEVLVSEDIYTASGIKLLAKGARIDARLWKTLSCHKLSKPLDQLLAASDCINHASLARDIDKIIAAHPLLASMLKRVGDPKGWKPILGSIRLPQALAFRFTVMRDEATQLYLHSLRIAIGAYCIGVRLRLTAPQLADLMLAAFCHDIGEMHTDPAILIAGRSIGGDERRFFDVHPVTGHVILQQLNAIPHDVMQAVLQHHERLDGSGYPHRERGPRIGVLARIIAVSETLDAVARRLDHGQIHIVFRLHQGRLDDDAMTALTDLLPQETDADSSGSDNGAGIERRLNRLCAFLRAWPALQEAMRHTSTQQDYPFVDERIGQLHSLARQCGITPGMLQMLDLGEDDGAMLRELHTTLAEMGRLLDGLAYEIERCIPADGKHGPLSRQIIGLLRQ
jgi:HD-GYP domain-containing protein (c-di-GMP phosphodiesterase class II)